MKYCCDFDTAAGEILRRFCYNNYRQERIFVKADGKNNRGIASKTIRTG
ncbi:hypothetical protein PZH37_02215 [[Eubacterium] siraeum]|nr:hypothetical protein [[Eubacterium] siraeum]